MDQVCLFASSYILSCNASKHDAQPDSAAACRSRTPLAWAAAAGANSMVRLLVQLGADLQATDAAGLVPRQLAHAND
jgi:ankyrin repeat protein